MIFFNEVKHLLNYKNLRFYVVKKITWHIFCKIKFTNFKLLKIKTMKKLIALCLVFVFSNAIFAQTVKEKTEKAKIKTEKAAADSKAKLGERNAEREKKEAEKLSELKSDKIKKAIEEKKSAKLKKDGTPDKRFKDAAEKEAKKTETKAKTAANKANAEANKTAAKTKNTVAKTKKTAAEESEDLKETALSKAAEKKVTDKATGTYKGKKVYTGPRGGKYYINKNGNKTYISDDK